MNREIILKQIEILINDYRDNKIGILANTSALLYLEMKDVNWVGFYFVSDNNLILGPFQGKPACMKIEYGKGVCGKSYEKDEVMNVSNVHLFPGHIACDTASNSEVVIPMHKDGKVYGVLDIDSPEFSNFTSDDILILQEVVKILESIL